MVRQCLSVAVATCLIVSPGTYQLAAAPAFASDPVGALTVSSEPPGAAVYVDGQFVGQTPIDVRNLQPGDHRVRLVKDGYLENGRVVSITAGKTGSLQVRLTARTTADALPEGQTGGISSGGGGGGSKKWLWIGLAGGGAAATTLYLLRDRIGSITASPSTGLQAATAIAFSAAGVSSGASLSWDFGDGSTSTERNPTHVYNTSGTFTAKCTVGRSSEITSVTIRSLTGTWRGTVPGTNPVTGTFMLTQSGTSISGTYSDVFGPATVTSGSMVKTTAPRVTIVINQPPFPPFIFTGEASSDVNSITGVLNQSGFNNDPLTITRQ